MNQLAIAMALPSRRALRDTSVAEFGIRLSRVGTRISSSRLLHFTVIAGAFTLLAADPAFAQAAAGGTGSLTTFLTNVVNLLTGQLGQAIAVIAVAGVGIAWALGQASPRFALGTVVGVAILFSAAWIVGQISGSGVG